MQKEVKELKEIGKIIDNGVYNIALAKAVQGGAYMGNAHGENMMDVGKWQYTEFISKMTVACIKSNFTATILSGASDIGLKKIKKIIYKNQDSNMLDKELRDKFKRYINGTTKRGECFTE